MKYKEQLLDPKWERKRLIILKRDKCRCTNCNLELDLQVHHIYYVYGKKGLVIS